jgi:hypothetical protein
VIGPRDEDFPAHDIADADECEAPPRPSDGSTVPTYHGRWTIGQSTDELASDRESHLLPRADACRVQSEGGEKADSK